MLFNFTFDICEFFSDRAVPATNIAVCNKVHHYSCMGFLYLHVRSMNTCAKWTAVRINCNAQV